MGQHLEVHSPVVTPQDADEAADDVRNDGGAHSGLKADERRFIGGGTHVRSQHIQLPTEVSSGVFFVVLQNPQDIPAGCQLLMDGGDEPGQFALDQLHSGLDQLIRPAALLEPGQNGQHHDEGAQDGQDQQARDDAEQDEAGLQDRISRVDLGRHIQPCRRELTLQPAVFVFVHSDQRRQLQRPAEDQRLQSFDQAPLPPSGRDERAFRSQPRDFQQVGKDKIQSGGQNGPEQK